MTASAGAWSPAGIHQPRKVFPLAVGNATACQATPSGVASSTMRGALSPRRISQLPPTQPAPSTPSSTLIMGAA